MPRLAPGLLREARARHALLPLLLRECRDLPSARNELRWLHEHAHASHGVPPRPATTNLHLNKAELLTYNAVWQTLSYNARRRAKGEPLQYILGSQPFGDLDILCREGVLIPRPETEAYTARLGSLLERAREPAGNVFPQAATLRILDLCTGTGCIPLMLHSILKPPGEKYGQKVKITGIDISDAALALSRENLEYNIGEHLLDLSAVSDISFKKVSVFELCHSAGGDGLEKLGLSSSTFDVLVSNPPYVSEQDYQPGGSTTRSVRKYEPKLALVPETTSMGDEIGLKNQSGANHGDMFYQPLLEIAQNVKASMVILETGDHQQALRVYQMATKMHRNDIQPVHIELWDDDAEDIDLANSTTRRARSVVIYNGMAAKLRKAEKDSAV